MSLPKWLDSPRIHGQFAEPLVQEVARVALHWALYDTRMICAASDPTELQKAEKRGATTVNAHIRALLGELEDA